MFKPPLNAPNLPLGGLSQFLVGDRVARIRWLILRVLVCSGYKIRGQGNL